MLGARSTRPQPGGTARKGFRSRLSQICAVLDQARMGASAPRDARAVVAKLKLESRRQAKLHPCSRIRRGPWPKASKGVEGCGAGRQRDRESGSVQGARIVNRLQKSERRIFLASMVRHGATREDPREAR